MNVVFVQLVLENRAQIQIWDIQFCILDEGSRSPLLSKSKTLQSSLWEYSRSLFFQKEETSGAMRKSPISSADSSLEESHFEKFQCLWLSLLNSFITTVRALRWTCATLCCLILTSTQMFFSLDEINIFHPENWLARSDSCFYPLVDKEDWQLNRIAHSAPLRRDLFVL